ncbi:MAG: Asp-tRNA(Asn)/Glu-tRNA(Gln) amidotransferase subunit GatA [Chloroflexia bacterium]|nr:Asp-tRNA(Asn)/Glu-tRNA(Gln) amidotransferase subunit GatA [Chloroflexia bacterium]
MESELYDLSIRLARALLDRGEISAVELCQAVLDRIVAVENSVRAYLAIAEQEALAQAGLADERIRAGQAGPLCGIPIAIKDNLCTRGLHTTCASRLLEDFVPPYDATVVARLRQAGAVLIGKTNLDEFAMGSSTEHSAFFATHNPWSLRHVPGGSSGGSAAAVAAGEALAALGSDTGGSIRQPAGFCGVVGLRPSYGRVSRYGLIAFASSLDQVGPLCRDVVDAALLLEAIAGPDPHDATTTDQAAPSLASTLAQTDALGSLRLGIPREYIEGLDPGVERAFWDAIDLLEQLGAPAVELSLPHTRYALPAYYIIAPAEASSNLARYDGVRYGLRLEGQDLWDSLAKTRGQGFGSEVRRRIMLGTYVLSSGYYDAYYRQAQRVRTLIRADFQAAFEQVNLLVGPTSPTTAFALDERREDPLSMYQADLLTLPASLAGLPAMSVPGGFAGELPVGLQFIGPAMDEATVLRAAHVYLEAAGWQRHRPALG